MQRITRARLIVFGLGAAFLAFAAANSQSIEERNPPSAVSGEHAVRAASEIEFTPPPNVTRHSAWIPLRYQAQANTGGPSRAL
jgi:hypothetical protein